ncbi:MAG: hypothetical protein ABUT39_07075 [Acidobacteriota bacterium]
MTGSDIDAWLDYTPPGSDEHDPGQSNQGAGFSLAGCLITVVERCRRIEDGYPKTGSQNAPYEVVKATVEGHQGDYFAWVVYEGVVKVEEHKPVVEPPGPDTDSEPGPEPEPPDSQTGDIQIEVHAGQTVVVEVKSTTTVLEGGSSPPEAEENRAKLREQIETARAIIADIRLALAERPDRSVEDDVDFQEMKLNEIAGIALNTNRTDVQNKHAKRLDAIIAALRELQAKLR